MIGTLIVVIVIVIIVVVFVYALCRLCFGVCRFLLSFELIFFSDGCAITFLVGDSRILKAASTTAPPVPSSRPSVVQSHLYVYVVCVSVARHSL